MVKKWFVCLHCGNRFQKEVFEEGEAEAKRVPAYPVACPECGGSVRLVD